MSIWAHVQDNGGRWGVKKIIIPVQSGGGGNQGSSPKSTPPPPPKADPPPPSNPDPPEQNDDQDNTNTQSSNNNDDDNNNDDAPEHQTDPNVKVPVPEVEYADIPDLGGLFGELEGTSSIPPHTEPDPNELPPWASDYGASADGTAQRQSPEAQLRALSRNAVNTVQDGNGDNDLYGTFGNDKFYVRTGNDIYMNRSGSDRFIFSPASRGDKLIINFSDNDRIVLTGSNLIGWPDVNEILYEVEKFQGFYSYTLHDTLVVWTTLPLRNENFIVTR